ncbi:hypothetical protein COV17_00885 [Candidatus Woesearchaeota archaeon CG10_big_fil_rev_8_21_14_0_10_36_11]|nr:MAG: hypothetical protein COV17_00885 [Candidatus Woesearchaeota archaeon CG10_big_fil_rev_8_21_14_0_10_36_11]
MGNPIVGETLTLDELAREADLIRRLNRDTIVHRFERVHPPLEYTTPEILSAGSEVEVTLVDQNRQPAPMYDELERVVGTEVVSPETFLAHAEVKNGSHNLFNLVTPYEKMCEIFREMLLPIKTAAETIGIDIALIGNHPVVNNEIGRRMKSQRSRYRTIEDNIGPHSQSVNVPFLDGDVVVGNDYINDYILGSLGSSTQTTLKVPHKFVPHYHDAYNLLGPLLLAISASSPFFDGKATRWDSVRIHLSPPLEYGFPDSDFKLGRPGRWGVSEPLTVQTGLSRWADRELYDKLKEHTSEEIARYFAEEAGYGHLLVTREDLNAPVGTFPKPTRWPWANIHSNRIMSREGLGIELRMGEMPYSSEEMASFVLTQMAMIQGLVERMYQGDIHPLTSDQVNGNIVHCASYALAGEKNVSWPIGTFPNTQETPLRSVFGYLGMVAAEVLERYNYSRGDIGMIINPVLTKAGVLYQHDGSFKEIDAEPTPAQMMRNVAYAQQPNVQYGERLRPETLSAMMDRFII